MQLFQKNYQHPEAHAHTHADIRKIEHRKLHEQQIDVVHNLAVEHTVDQVADAAGKDQQQCGLLQVSAAASEEQPVGHKDQRYAGSDDEEQLLAAEQLNAMPGLSTNRSSTTWGISGIAPMGCSTLVAHSLMA